MLAFFNIFDKAHYKMLAFLYFCITKNNTMDLIIKNLDKQTTEFICYIAEKSGGTIVKESANGYVKSKAFKENSKNDDPRFKDLKEFSNELRGIIRERIKNEL